MKFFILLLLVLAHGNCSSSQKTKTGKPAPSTAEEPDISERGCKRGGAYGFHSSADMKAFSKGASWWYNWSSKADEGIRETFQEYGIEFVPMIWNGDFDVDTLIRDIPDGSKYLLGFNEPNFKSQANLSPTEAAALWPKVERVAKARGLKIVGPAVNYCGPASNCHETDPFQYLDKFLAACRNCQIDYLAVHWYACHGEYLKNYLQGFAKYQKPLWVTEFSCGDGNNQEKSAAGQKTYMAEALEILEKDPKVFRYSWFSSRTTAIPNANLFAASGMLTDLGKEYLAFPSEGDCSF